MLTVTLYSRTDCHLCDQAKADLESLAAEIPHKLVVVDVDSSAELQRQYGFDLPVIEIGPYRLKVPISAQEIRITLLANQDRHDQLQALETAADQNAGPAGRTWTKADRFTYWISRHYLAILNCLVVVYLGLSVLAPVLMEANATIPATWLYRIYSLVCHQLAFRSFFLFGEQAVYPRAAAGVKGLLSLQQATGLNEDNSANALFAARAYVGSPTIGYKIALCERDVAIYASILLFGLVYALTKRKLPPIPWYIWLLAGLIPIAMDGGSQLVSQLPIGLIPFRESTPLLRVLTGTLFGFITAWFAYPMVEESMADSSQLMANKLARIQRLTHQKVSG